MKKTVRKGKGMAEKYSIHDLRTDDEEIVRGVNWQRKNKVEYALHFNEKAERAIKKIQKNPHSIKKLIEDKDVFDFMVGVLMYSQKSLYYVPRKEIIRQIKMNLKPEKFSERRHLSHLKTFYMMSAGESNGGRMRNLIGKKGNELLCRYIVDGFDEKEVDYSMKKVKGNIQEIETDDLIILFNKKPKFINKSIDFIILKKDSDGEYDIEDPKSYISAGELKSGIDPSGADEHWKTATTALSRIREGFKNIGEVPPDLYFVGGAISNHMAQEIIEAIEVGDIQGAANLNKEGQVKKLVSDFLERKQDIKPSTNVKKKKRSAIKRG